MNAVVELFGVSVSESEKNWADIVNAQKCPFLGGKCYKVRKSDADTSIGTCIVRHGKKQDPVLICPARLISKGQIFTDCIHLLTTHEPGNELHVVTEVQVPGGRVDYFLVSARKDKVKDFVGIELQTVDTTGTVWPERQRLLRKLGIPRNDESEKSNKPFGMNWKMTAKTILMQTHHKIQTFEYINKKLVLVVQDKLLEYMLREFDFSSMKTPSLIGDSMHLHAYALEEQEDASHKLTLDSRLSTDMEGIASCLGLNAEARIQFQQIVQSLEARLSHKTRFIPV